MRRREPKVGKDRMDEDDPGRDRAQFIAQQIVAAVQRPGVQDPISLALKVGQDAASSWDRKEKIQRGRDARTTSLQNLLSDPEIPDDFDAIAAREQVTHILASIDVLLAEVLRLRYLEGHSVTRNTVKQALKAAREVSGVSL